jgi:hypothetical protein
LTRDGWAGPRLSSIERTAEPPVTAARSRSARRIEPLREGMDAFDAGSKEGVTCAESFDV